MIELVQQSALLYELRPPVSEARVARGEAKVHELRGRDEHALRRRRVSMSMHLGVSGLRDRMGMGM